MESGVNLNTAARRLNFDLGQTHLILNKEGTFVIKEPRSTFF